MDDNNDVDVLTPESKKILDKTNSELTVGDNMKLAAVTTAVMVGSLAAFLGVVAGVSSIAARRRAKKDAKKVAEPLTVVEVVEEKETPEETK